MEIENSSFATFFFRILKNANKSNLNLFISICGIDDLYQKGSLEDTLPLANKIMLPFLLEKGDIAKRVIELTKNLYFNYYCYEPFSKRTVEQDDEDGNCINQTVQQECRDTITSGGLNHQEFNCFLKELLNTYKKHHLFYEIQTDSISVRYYNPEMKLIDTETSRLKKRGRRYCLYRNGKAKYIATKNKMFIGLKAILNIHRNIINELQTHLEACMWCNPIKPTKHKCDNCKELYEAYQELRKKHSDLPKDINQLIKRAGKNTDKLDITRKNKINKKIIATLKD